MNSRELITPLTWKEQAFALTTSHLHTSGLFMATSHLSLHSFGLLDEAGDHRAQQQQQQQRQLQKQLSDRGNILTLGGWMSLDAVKRHHSGTLHSIDSRIKVTFVQEVQQWPIFIWHCERIFWHRLHPILPYLLTNSGSRDAGIKK